MNRFLEALRETKGRLISLQIFTGLVVTFVRHALDPHRVPWDSFLPFLSSWIIHTVALTVLVAFVWMAIFCSHKFFLGKDFKANEFDVWFYILMTVLVASVCILFVAGYVPSDEE